MTAGDSAAEQSFFLQPGNGAAEGKRQSRFVGHDIGNPASRPVIFQHRHGGSNHAVQFPDKHRSFVEAAKAGQQRPVAGGILLAAEHAHLPGSIAELHDMAAAFKRGQRVAEIKFHKVIASAAQRQVDRGCVQQEPVSRLHRPGKKVVIYRRFYNAVNDHFDFADPATGLNFAGHANLMTDHQILPPLLNSPLFRIILAHASVRPSEFCTLNLKLTFPGNGPGNRGGAILDFSQ